MSDLSILSKPGTYRNTALDSDPMAVSFPHGKNNCDDCMRVRQIPKSHLWKEVTLANCVIERDFAAIAGTNCVADATKSTGVSAAQASVDI